MRSLWFFSIGGGVRCCCYAPISGPFSSWAGIRCFVLRAQIFFECGSPRPRHNMKPKSLVCSIDVLRCRASLGAMPLGEHQPDDGRRMRERFTPFGLAALAARSLGAAASLNPIS